ncbi:MAG TPA: RNA polymerase sigma factor [Phycisphaerales bacterium]|nr:RNA polymerase sigma factor [Phycisphaerales bacterium]
MSETDRYYVERCLDGHPDDYRHLVKRYQGPLLASVAGRLGNCETAEEVAQETLVRAYFKMKTLKQPESFFSWLLGIADRVAKEHVRKQSVRRQRELVRSVSTETAAPEFSQDLALESAIAALPDPYRKIILLRYYGDCSCVAIARQLDMPIGTVTKTLSRAYAMLRSAISRQESLAQEATP